MTILFTQQADFSLQRVLGVASPSLGTDAANKQYVDNIAAGMVYKDAVKVASTGDLNLSAPGLQIDGVTLQPGDRVLVKNQSNGAQNGIYVFNGGSSPLTRASDFDADNEAKPGSTVSVLSGTTNAGTLAILTTQAPITLGTTPLTFSPLNISGAQYVGGNGLTLTGTTFDVGQGTGILVGADTISVDTSIVTRKFAANVGDGSNTSITLNHNLSTYDVQVEVFQNSGNRSTVFCEVQRPSANSVALVFASAPASGAYRAVVMG